MDAFSSMELRLEKLSAEHDISAFDCNAIFINKFLQESALSEAVDNISQTYVLVGTSQDASEEVIGYFTLQADSFYDAEEVHGYSTIPVVSISWFARHIELRGQKVGSVLMYQVMRIVAQASTLIGIAGIHVAQTNEGAKLYTQFQFGAHPYGKYNMFLPIATVREYAHLVKEE